jgi:hypothetical protein
MFIHTYITGYQVNSGVFLHNKRFYIASSPQDADNKGSVSSYCVKTVFVTRFGEIRDTHVASSYMLKFHVISEIK